jgi:replication-associated recombination protein RarA
MNFIKPEILRDSVATTGLGPVYSASASSSTTSASSSSSLTQPTTNILAIHENIRKKLHSFYVSNRIPHIIFYGSSGAGKQTLVYDFLREIYHGNEQKIKSNVMFVNCAHGKGIKFIREELKFFAKTNVQFKSGIWFKTIVLLNADHLTMDAQSALRRCIELFSHNTRFFIIVENKHKLLNPILSRFCEIYVPEYMNEEGEIVNLHQWQIQQVYNFKEKIQEKQFYIENVLRDYFCSRMEKQLSTAINKLTHQKMTEIANQFYEKGLSSLDLIKWVKQSKYWTDLEKSNICMCFSKIKMEFRCEKLLMLFLLDFLYMRCDYDLKEISLM